MVYKESLSRGILPKKLDAGWNFNLMVRTGIPTKFREKFWTIFVGHQELIEMTKGIYQLVLEDYKDEESEATEQIDKDITRTFPGRIGGFSDASLRRVLVAYSWRNTEIGYCQSMNFIAAGLLTTMSEENVFWMLSYITEKLLPNYFAKDLIGSRVDANILSILLCERLPKLYQHFRKISFQISTVVTQWFLCLYITSVPTETAFIIWDNLFYHGVVVLFEVAVAIFKLHEKHLLTIKEEMEMALFLSGQAAQMFDSDEIWELWDSPSMKSITSAKIHQLREQVRQKLEENENLTELQFMEQFASKIFQKFARQLRIHSESESRSFFSSIRSSSS